MLALEEMDPKKALALILREIEQRTESNQLDTLYPDDGPLRRELYVKYVQALEAGKECDERIIMGGNRVGKTLGIGGYETALHLTGLYPDWWDGRVFDKQILVWAAGTKSTKVRDVNQKMLLGQLQKAQGFTTGVGGLIPRAKIGRLTRKMGVADAVDQAVIKHVDGYENLLTFKSYEEGRASFEAEAVDFIWLDEEKGLSRDMYDECKMRIITTRGAILSTFTPVEGMTETVLAMLEGTDLM